jgi:hypothetical protein
MQYQVLWDTILQKTAYFSAQLCKEDVMLRWKEESPRRISTTLCLLAVLFVAAVVAGAYLNRDTMTAFVVSAGLQAGVSDSCCMTEHIVLSMPPEAIAIPEQTTPMLLEPTCVTECGRACWLAASGAAEGDYDSAQGRIGALGCDGACWSIESARCCRNADCARGELCVEGVCI